MKVVRYLFEDYALDTARRELRRGGALVAVEPQVFDLLAYLVQHGDRRPSCATGPVQSTASAARVTKPLSSRWRSAWTRSTTRRLPSPLRSQRWRISLRGA